MSEYDITRAFKRIENDLMDSMMRNMKKHQVEEKELGITWEQWQTLQLKELERYRRTNAELFDEDFKQINRKIDAMFKATCDDAQAEEEARLLDDMRKGKFTTDYNRTGEYFNLNDKKLNNLITATRADFVRGENAMLRRANDIYRQVIFDAMTYANITNDYKKAVDMATHDFLLKGINCIQYKNGARHTMQDYASMAIRTGNKRAYLMGEGNAHDKLGLHVVRVNKRTHACPLCVRFLGKLLIDDVYGGGTDKEASELGIPTLSQAMDEGFLHPNCKDIYSVYIEGVSQPAKGWSRQEIEEIVGEYNQEQQVKHANDMAESYSRLAKYQLDEENRIRYQQKADWWLERAEQAEAGDVLQWNLPELVIEPVPEIDRSGIRQLIDIKYDHGSLIGVNEIPDIKITKIDDVISDVELGKQLKISWDNLSELQQNVVRWNIPQRAQKDFIIQKADLRFITTDMPKAIQMNIQPALDAGYNYVGYVRIYKYHVGFDVTILEKGGKHYVVIGNAESQNAISKATMNAIIKREKEVSKALWDKGVRYKDLTARRGDDWVNAMTKFHTAMGADKPVTLVTREAYDAVKGEELYRGIAPVSHLRKDLSMSKTVKECANQLMLGGVGDCFPSRGVYGDVVAYLSNSKDVGFNYATGYGSNSGGYILRMKIKDDAKTITYKDAEKLFNEINKAHPQDAMPYFSKNQVALSRDVEVGKAMQMLGYDVIYEPRGDGGKAHFYMVLNRDAIVAVKDDWVEAVVTDSMIKRGRL